MNEYRNGDSVGVTFVIPAYNEEKYIVATLASIHVAAVGLMYEIVLVDNGSTDRTPALAAENGARVIEHQGGTIGAMRNVGANEARGAIIVFLDADVTLTPEWRPAFDRVSAMLRGPDVILAGSSCDIPTDASWIERAWFAPRSDNAASHIGSAHLIVRTAQFLDAGGFDETLETGEDYDLSLRIVRSGGRLHRLPRSVVQHHGFPKTIGHFFRREVWHGTSDFSSLRSVMHSTVALASVVFVSLHVAAAALLLGGFGAAAVACVIAIVIVCAASSVRAFARAGAQTLLTGTVLYYVYYAARAMSFVRARRVKRPAPRSRETAPQAA